MYCLYIEILCRATNIDNRFWNSHALSVYYLKPWAVNQPCYKQSFASLRCKGELWEARPRSHSLTHSLLLWLTTVILCITTDYLLFSTVIFWFKNTISNLHFFPSYYCTDFEIQPSCTYSISFILLTVFGSCCLIPFGAVVDMNCFQFRDIKYHLIRNRRTTFKKFYLIPFSTGMQLLYFWYC